MDDYRVTATHETRYRAADALAEASERVLEHLMAEHADLGPVTDADLAAMTLSVTVTFDAADPVAAASRAGDIIGPALRDVEAADLVGVEVSRVREREPEPVAMS